MSVTILEGDARQRLTELPADSFDCCVTSPPYWGLRDYGAEGQIGLEPTLPEYLAEMVSVCREVWRVLKPSGTFWLNIGDSYADKSLCMVPNRLAILLHDDGWLVRSEIVWHKPNPMPESATDRPTNSHEKVWLLTKSDRYFYNAEAIAEPSCAAKDRPQRARAEQLARGAGLTQAHFDAIRAVGVTDAGKARVTQGGFGKNDPAVAALASEAKAALGGYYREFLIAETVNARNVWSIATQPFRGAHFATMTPELAERCIKAGSPVWGHVLDPFGGAGDDGARS